MMMLTLVRHAKSDWGTPNLADHDRPLNDRGLRDAPAMAKRFVASRVPVELLLSSTALRARTTAGFFGDALGVDVTLDENLYGASSRTLWDTAANTGASSVMLVAHNPGISVLANQLVPDIDHMPTCAVASFMWDDDDWAVLEDSTPVRWTLDTPKD